MKYIRKYSYLILVFLFLLIIVLIMSSKNKRSASSVTITESSAGAMTENKSNLQGGDNSAEKIIFTSSEAQEGTDNTTITESSEKAIDTNRSHLPGSDNSTGETMFSSSEIPAQMDSITIAESSTKAIDENRSYSPEGEYPEEKMVFTNPRTSEEETVSANPETLKGEMISASLETPEEEMTSASPGVPEEETISVSQEAEKSHAIEGIPGYEYADRFPADMVFASQESIELLADIYENIGFEGEFQFGDKTVYDFYRQKYSLILDRKVKIYDRKGNESLLYNRYNPMGRLQYQLNIQEATDKLYFFDIDGDGLPELCVQGTSGTYICKYDADSDQYMEWWGATNSGYTILGTRKIAADHCGDREYLFLLDKDGYTECEIIFYITYQTGRITHYLVSVPDFEERVSDGQIPDSMKQQMAYDEFSHTYYLRVTKEQYKELIKGLYEARKTAKEYQVPFSYFFDSED